ncbi:hypothetical protein, partial [Kitasatospora putterlickiae]|uniref:hypothetical protein n=1 Tax=Kitasatospora putterlickiae TaxID=221725 RepID=UPI0031CFBBA3
MDMTAGRGGNTLSDYAKNTGITGFALAFVGVKEGTTRFTWGGFDSYPAPGWFGSEIDEFRKSHGGVPVIGFGGGDKILPEHSITNDPAALLKGYQEVIDKYQVRHIDFDIEANVSSGDLRKRNAALVADLLKKYTDLRVSYSLEINARGDDIGLKKFGLNLLGDLQKAGIVPALVNLLIEYLPDPQWDSARNTLEAVHKQLVDIFKIGSDEAWRRLGA